MPDTRPNTTYERTVVERRPNSPTYAQYTWLREQEMSTFKQDTSGQLHRVLRRRHPPRPLATVAKIDGESDTTASAASKRKPHRRRVKTMAERACVSPKPALVLQPRNSPPPPPNHLASNDNVIKSIDPAISPQTSGPEVSLKPKAPGASKEQPLKRPTRARKVDVSTSMPTPPRIKSIKSLTYQQVETGLILRRRALLASVRAARRELGNLCQAQMPPLLVTLRRNEVLGLKVPLDCVCTRDEEVVLARTLWQDEKREGWLQQQAEECSMLLRHAEEKLAKLAGTNSCKANPTSARPRSRSSWFKPAKDRYSTTSTRPRHHHATCSPHAKNHGTDPRLRVRKYDRRSALLVFLIAVLALPIPLFASRWPEARIAFLEVRNNGSNTDTMTSSWCNGVLNVQHFPGLEKYVQQAQELREKIRK